MSAIQALAAQPWVARLAWTLIDFLWQGTAIAVLYFIARHVLRSARPNLRYLLGCTALAAMLAAPIVTWSLHIAPEAPVQRGSTIAPAGVALWMTVAAESDWNTISGLPSSGILAWVVALWLAGAIALWLRLVGGWITAARMRSIRVKPAPPGWEDSLGRLAARIGVSRPVRLLVSGLVQVPSVIGWLRPVVLMPVGAFAGLPADHVEALLVHELAHIRRHDYLVNVLQGVVEALLFYHPAVWWISGHIRAERELCCDDVAVSATGDALSYARALTGLEASRMRAVMAANGGNLAGRISHLLGEARPESRTLGGPAILIAVTLAVLVVCTLSGQPSAAARFDVASIKPHKNISNVVHRTVDVMPGGRLVAKDATLRQLIQSAYGVRFFQVSGGPAWAASDGFDIEAKSDANPSRAQAWLMLRALLDDRFHLKLRRETKEMAVLDLTVAKNGARLSPAKEGACEGSPSAPSTSSSPTCGNGWIRGERSGAAIEGFGMVMGDLARTLSNAVGSIVVDKTGITQRFDVRLEFDSAGMGGGAGKPAASVTTPPDSSGPTLFNALQEKLGLKLESSRGPVEILVIEHAEKPTEN